MADLTYKVTVDTAQADKALNGLSKSISGLKTALGGLAIGSFVANAYRSAAAVKDLSDQTGLAVQSILGLRRAFEESGSSAAAADAALLRLTKNIGDAKTGNDELAKTFEQLGVDVYDSTATIDEQILKVVDGLGRIKDQSIQTQTAIQVGGKGAAAAFSEIAKNQRGYIAGSLEAATAINAAEAAQEQFQRAITNIQTELLKVLKPLNEFIANIKISSESISEFIKTVAAIGGVILAFTALGKAISLVRGGISLVAGGFALIKKGGESLAKTWELIVFQFGKFRQAGEFTKETIAGMNKRFKFLTDGVGMLGKGLGILAAAFGSVFAYFNPDAVLNAFSKIGQFLGVIKTEEEKLAAERQRQAEAAAARQKEEDEAYAQSMKLIDEKIKGIKDIGKAYKEANASLLENLDNELKYLKMSEREAELARALDDVEKNRLETVKKLQQELEKLPQGEKNRRAEIQKTIDSINADTAATVSGLKTKIPLLQQEREAIEERNRALAFSETIRQDTAGLQSMRDEIDMLYMTTEQRAEYAKKLDNERGLKERLAAIDREAATLGKNITEGQIADFERRRQAAIDYYTQLSELQAQEKTAREDQARQIDIWGKETKKALEDSISPANQVKNFWDGLSSQIDNFSRTGKFKIKEFLAGIIQDFIAAKLKLAALDFLKSFGFGGGGGLLGGSIIPGFLAGGGNAQQGKPYVVGEKGPELFVPPTAGRVVPNHAVGSGQVSAPVTNNYITNNISALDAQSVAQLFAANRKTLLGTVKLAEKELPYAA